MAAPLNLQWKTYSIGVSILLLFVFDFEHAFSLSSVEIKWIRVLTKSDMRIFRGTAEFRGKYFLMWWEKTCSAKKTSWDLPALDFLSEFTIIVSSLRKSGVLPQPTRLLAMFFTSAVFIKSSCQIKVDKNHSTLKQGLF